MLANAISSAVDRLYAAAPVADERAAVSRVGAVVPVARVKAAGQGDPDNQPVEAREERERAQQRQSLTRGVLAVFETGAANDAAAETGATDKDGGERPAAEASDPDPVLEAAILRFIHSMFRTLAAEEPAVAPLRPVTGSGGSGEKSPFQLPSVSREALGARIDALAQRLAKSPESESESAPAGGRAAASASAGDAAPPVPDQNLQQAFAEVVQALRGNLGTSEPQAQSTRAELVSMMQRLAQAMQGTPPIDSGLSTRGGLLSARA